MAGGDQIKVVYANVAQAVADIRALESLAAELMDIEAGLEQSKGPGKEALLAAASALRSAAAALQGLLGRSAALVEQAGIEFNQADEQSASSMKSIA